MGTLGPDPGREEQEGRGAWKRVMVTQRRLRVVGSPGKGTVGSGKPQDGGLSRRAGGGGGWRVAGGQLRGKRVFLLFQLEAKGAWGREAGGGPSGRLARNLGCRKEGCGQAAACWSWGTAAQPGELGQAGHAGFLRRPPLAAAPCEAVPGMPGFDLLSLACRPAGGGGQGPRGQGSVAGDLGTLS